MNPTIFGVIGPGSLNQIPTLGGAEQLKRTFSLMIRNPALP